jgi:hypothetical protein
MNKIANVKIVETQQESEIDDEILFTLFVDGKTVSWAKSILYSNLEDIHTACLEKRKGYGRELLTFIEKNAKNHGATLMRTSDFNACNDEATNFFKNGHYEVNPSVSGLNTSVKATKFFK